MAEVKIIDIDGVQWEMKDQTARNKITEQETKINSLQDNLNTIDNKIYLNQSKNLNITNSNKWFKIENIYPKDEYFSPNIFLIGTRRGGIYLLSCSTDDNNTYWNPVLIKLHDTLNRIISVKAKGKAMYIQSAQWNSIYIQQLNGTPKQIIVTEENPPEDAKDITIIEK